MAGRRRVSGWMLFALILGIPAAFLGLTLVLVLGILRTQLEEHEREAAALLEEAPPVDPGRPAILSPGEAGNVWELLLPALAGLRNLDPSTDLGFGPGMAANWDAHGIPADTPRLIEEAGPFLEQCRRAAHRSDLAWRGPRDAERRILQDAGLGARALCSKALLLWRDGRDAEALEWLIVALTLTEDVARRKNSWDLQRIGEAWVLEDCRSILSWQALSAESLEEFDRHLEALRRVRPSFLRRLRQADGEARKALLDEDPSVQSRAPWPESSGQLSEQVGWRDFFSVRVAKVRILHSIRSCARQLEEGSTPAGPPDAAEVDRILSLYQGRFVPDLLPFRPVISEQQVENSLADLLKFALAVARFQALQGHFPQTREEVRVDRPVVRRIVLLGDGFQVTTGSSGVPEGIDERFRDWEIRRRP